MLKKITITGADDGISPIELVHLSREYPFVEFGILLSKSSAGQSRYPSMDFIRSLEAYKSVIAKDMQLAGHICGKWVRGLLHGNPLFFEDIEKRYIDMFNRLQLNCHGDSKKDWFKEEDFDFRAFRDVCEMFSGIYIMPIDDLNNNVLFNLWTRKVEPLFDCSCGNGILPSNWPKPYDGILSGYAGGLNPDNLEEQVNKIIEVTNNNDFWIDMESGVRTDNKFDLDKVRRCLEIGKKYIK